MPKEIKSQWEFGDLFSQPAARQVVTVSQLTTNLRLLLEKQFASIWVSGEITNLRLQTSGHIYFTLKDANAQLGCVLFRNELLANRQLLADGQKVVVQGALTVFEPRGQYQLRVLAVELQGVGALQAAFERLKAKLQAEGLFATARKRPIPRFPQCVGLVTSESGAAIRDVLHVVQRRDPGLRIVLAPCRVQGAGADLEIATAIRLLNDWSAAPGNRVDVVLVTRGGGSLEDLWAFNEELVARAIFHSRIPVVSAVGHEVDVTISDFVADFRAATPSAAAEILTEGAFSGRRKMAEIAPNLRNVIRRQLDQRKLALRHLQPRLERLHPRRQLNDKLQYLDELRASLLRCARQSLRQQRGYWQNLQSRFLRFRPALILAQRKQTFIDLQRRITEAAHHKLDLRRRTCDHLASRVRLLSPQNVLTRGYSITLDAASGHVIRNQSEVRSGQKLKSMLSEGQISSEVTES